MEAETELLNQTNLRVIIKNYIVERISRAIYHTFYAARQHRLMRPHNKFGVAAHNIERTQIFANQNTACKQQQQRQYWMRPISSIQWETQSVITVGTDDKRLVLTGRSNAICVSSPANSKKCWRLKWTQAEAQTCKINYSWRSKTARLLMRNEIQFRITYRWITPFFGAFWKSYQKNVYSNHLYRRKLNASDKMLWLSEYLYFESFKGCILHGS